MLIMWGMMSLDEIRQRLAEQESYLADIYGVRVVGIFGSYVRNEQHPDSDIDILVELQPSPRLSLIDLVELEHYLGEVLGRKVDITLKESLRKRIGRRILDEVVPL